MFLPLSPNLAAHRLHACVVQLGQQVDETGLQRELRRHGSLSCYSLLEPLELPLGYASPLCAGGGMRFQAHRPAFALKLHMRRLCAL